MQINQNLLIKGILPIAACSLMIGCVDDKYDLSDIDTSSQFTVKDLTIPINLETIELKNIIDIDDDDPNIKVEDGIYTIKESGAIDPTEFSIDKVNVNVPKIDQTAINIPINVPGVSAGSYIPTTGDLVNLKGIDVPKSEMVEYSFKMDDVPEALLQLSQINTSAIAVKVTLSVPNELAGPGNKISFNELQLKLPQDLTNVKGVNSYNPETGDAIISNVQLDSKGKAEIDITANGLNLGDKGKVVNKKLAISGSVGILGGKINISLGGIYLPEALKINVDYGVSPFTVESFSGKIDYKMDDITIDPISLDDLPDFLNDPQTNIIIENPVIFIEINNPVGQYGLKGHGQINLVSNFSNGSVSHTGQFDLSGNTSKIAFCANKAKFKAPQGYEGYEPVEIEGLDKILTNGNAGLPQSISGGVTNLKFDGTITNLPLGDLGAAYGNYAFYAPFAFGEGTKIIYNTTEDGWGGDDLDDVNIESLKIETLCTSDLPVDISLKVQPIDKNGNLIDVEEVVPFKVPANCKDQKASLSIKGKNNKPIKNFDGVIFEAVVTQNNPEAPALGPNITLQLKDLKITVSGYYNYVEDKK